MTASVANVTSGPAQVLIADADAGHTEGGVTVTISPKTRMRTVDQYGKGECAIIHDGDTVRVQASFAEWVAMTLKNVYKAGNDQTAASGAKYMGVGRTAGYLYAGQDLKVVPRLTADAAKKAQFYNAAPIGDIKLEHTVDKDRIFEIDFAAMIDETKTDGELIGKVFLTAP